MTIHYQAIRCPHCLGSSDWCDICYGTRRLAVAAPRRHNHLLVLVAAILMGFAVCAFAYTVWANWQALWNWSF